MSKSFFLSTQKMPVYFWLILMFFVIACFICTYYDNKKKEAEKKRQIELEKRIQILETVNRLLFQQFYDEIDRFHLFTVELIHKYGYDLDADGDISNNKTTSK